MKRLVLRKVTALVLATFLSCQFAACNEFDGTVDPTDALIPYARLNYAKALELLTPLANQGHAVAQLTLARMYSHGEGVSPDDIAAIGWYRKAAEQGETDAEFELGIMYRDGAGTAADGHSALYWFKRAAARGAPHAFNAIGELYLYHPGIPQDYHVALEWFTRGAELDSAAAMYNIGILYALGWGVERDQIEALMWFDLAADAGPGGEHDKAVSARIALAESLMPLQIRTAKLKAEHWHR
jgi:TPR repeat protein